MSTTSHEPPGGDPNVSVREGDVNPLGRLLFSVAEVADALCVSTTTVRHLTHQGDLRAVTIGKRMLYREQDVHAFVESLSSE